MPKVPQHVKENKTMYIVVTAFVSILTGSGIAIDFPESNSEKFETGLNELRLEVAQNYNQREQQYQQQQNYHRRKELQDVDFELRWITAEINRLNEVPNYFNRGFTSQEIWQMEQLKIQWNLLQERRLQLTN